MVTPESSKAATLAAAYEVTGDQLVAYLERQSGGGEYGEPLSDGRDSQRRPWICASSMATSAR
jgi:hypothetical protein